MAQARIDENRTKTLLAVSNADGFTPVPLWADPITHRLLVDLPGGGSGTVTSVSVVSANGFAGTVATDTTTPAITLSTTITGILSGNGTAISAASTTGSGSVVLATSPTLVTPVLGVATATSINKVTLTSPATGSTLTIADGKTLTASNTLTFTGTDSSSVAFGTGGTVAYTSNKLSVFAATTSAELAGVISDETGSGSLVFATSPTLVTPALGTPTALVATNATGTATGLTSGITNALKSATTTVDVSAATAPSVGQVLTATDSTHATWQAASGGGWEIVAESTLGSDGLTLIDATSISTDYDVFRITLYAHAASGKNPYIRLRFNNDSGSTYYTQSSVVNSTTQSGNNTNTTYIVLSRNASAEATVGTNNSYSAEIIIYKPLAAKGGRVTGTYSSNSSGSLFTGNFSGDWQDTTNKISRITIGTFVADSENYLTGSVCCIEGRKIA